MTASRQTAAGIILAGGLSRRMEGQEKTLLEIGGKPIIAQVADRLARQTPILAINANGDPARFAELSLPVIADTMAGNPGPLAGILAGMRWVLDQHEGVSHVLSVAGDTPFFPQDLLDKLSADNDDPDTIVLAASNGRRHPVFGLWPVALAAQLEDFLVREAGRKVMLFVERYPLRIEEFATGAIDPFFNINTPDDLSQALKLAESGEAG